MHCLSVLYIHGAQSVARSFRAPGQHLKDRLCSCFTYGRGRSSRSLRDPGQPLLLGQELDLPLLLPDLEGHEHEQQQADAQERRYDQRRGEVAASERVAIDVLQRQQKFSLVNRSLFSLCLISTSLLQMMCLSLLSLVGHSRLESPGQCSSLIWHVPLPTASLYNLRGILTKWYGRQPTAALSLDLSFN